MSVQKCNCGTPHTFQDKRYGKGKRVMSETAKENVYRCTVCGNEVMVMGKSDKK